MKPVIVADNGKTGFSGSATKSNASLDRQYHVGESSWEQETSRCQNDLEDDILLLSTETTSNMRSLSRRACITLDMSRNQKR